MITPALVTVAIDVLLLDQVPSVVGVSAPVLPIQTDAGAVIAGCALIVTDDVVALHPVDDCVKVNVAEPALTPVTTPALETVAIAVLLLTHVPPLVGESVPVDPTHMADGAVSTGNAFTLTVTVLVN